MEKFTSQGYKYFCLTLEELLQNYGNDIRQIDNAVLALLVDEDLSPKYVPCIYIKDRGILVRFNKGNKKTIIRYFILQCQENLTHKNIYSKCFKEAKLINPHYDCAPTVLYTISNTSIISNKDMTKDIMQLLVDMFLNYSNLPICKSI